MFNLKRTIAAAELVLIAPSALFMTAIVVRNVTPIQHEPAHTAQRIVLWFAGLPVHVGLWGMLMAMPLAVFVLGALTLLQNWTADETLRQAARQTVKAIRTHLATFVIAAATLLAAGILAFVGIHALTD